MRHGAHKPALRRKLPSTPQRCGVCLCLGQLNGGIEGGRRGEPPKREQASRGPGASKSDGWLCASSSVDHFSGPALSHTGFCLGGRLADGQERLNGAIDDRPGSARCPWSDGYALAAPVDSLARRDATALGWRICWVKRMLWKWLLSTACCAAAAAIPATCGTRSGAGTSVVSGRGPRIPRLPGCLCWSLRNRLL